MSRIGELNRINRDLWERYQRIASPWESSSVVTSSCELEEKPKPKPKPKPKQTASWDSVILPKEIKTQIMAAISQIENKDKIFEEWGFSNVLEKGCGVTMLFAGLPGTGKTLAAEAIANQIGMGLYICNSGNLQSSLVGQMEKNVTAAFDRAKSNNEILLFDEADSLLGSRDRVGNIMRAEINHLLTAIERHEGVVIFTTNRLSDLDTALERRISLKIEFPFPDQEAREKIWKRMIPEKCPIDENVNLGKLASYPMAGGDIKNVVINAARMAVYEKSTQIKLDHFLQAIETEALSKKKFDEARKKNNRGFKEQIMESIVGDDKPDMRHNTY